MSKIKILYVTAEIAPYASAGGLGEVGKSFPEELANTMRYEVHRVMPLYKGIKAKLEYLSDFPVAMEQGFETCVVKKDSHNKEIPTYFIQNDRYFYRDHIYSYEDDGFRFYFFCKAVIGMLKTISFQPDIVHTNDWHTGFLAMLLKKELPKIKTIYTIHNISYHGFLPANYLSIKLSEEELIQLGYPQWLNFMKAGIVYSDLVTTVSPGYATEIIQPNYGCGMDMLLREKSMKLVGILNGIDAINYNPGKEMELKYPYDSVNPVNKKRNRRLLRERYGLPDEEKPLLAMISRLDMAKGFDILLKAISYLDLTTFQLIILGSGNPYYQGMLAGITAEYADNVVIEFQYSEKLAKEIYAGADIYLMPSLYEPCGLGQLNAMRYGTIPIVNPVGGLGDTVIDSEKPEDSTGFYMKDWSGEALSQAISRAIEAYHSPSWTCYIKNAMSCDFSWKRSIAEYQRCYEALL